jgi:hypothetical protein
VCSIWSPWPSAVNRQLTAFPGLRRVTGLAEKYYRLPDRTLAGRGSDRMDDLLRRDTVFDLLVYRAELSGIADYRVGE